MKPVWPKLVGPNRAPFGTHGSLHVPAQALAGRVALSRRRRVARTASGERTLRPLVPCRRSRSSGRRSPDRRPSQRVRHGRQSLPVRGNGGHEQRRAASTLGLRVGRRDPIAGTGRARWLRGRKWASVIPSGSKVCSRTCRDLCRPCLDEPTKNLKPDVGVTEPFSWPRLQLKLSDASRRLRGRSYSRRADYPE